MYSFGKRSTTNLLTADPRLIEVAQTVILYRDHSILQGYRDEATQNYFYECGTSKVKYPNSKHNALPSLAIDVQPYPREQHTQFINDLSYLAGLYVATAAAKGITLRWGGDWNSDGQTTDETFRDMFHFEIVQ